MARLREISKVPSSRSARRNSAWEEREAGMRRSSSSGAGACAVPAPEDTGRRIQAGAGAADSGRKASRGPRVWL